MENKRISMNEKTKKLLDFMKQYPKIDIRFGYERQNENVLNEYSISREEFEEIQKYYRYVIQNKEKLTEEEKVGLQEACIDPTVFGYSSEIQELSEKLKEPDFSSIPVEMELFWAIKKYGSIENIKNVYLSMKIDISKDYSDRSLASRLIGLENPELAKETNINYNYLRIADISGVNSDSIKKLMTKLTPKEKEIISYRYGLESGKIASLEKTSSELLVTRERIRQIEAKAFKRLKDYSSRISKETELSDLQEEDQKCDEALALVEELDKEQEGQTQGEE